MTVLLNIYRKINPTECTSPFRDCVHSLSLIPHFVQIFLRGQKPNYLTFNYSLNCAQSPTRIANTRANTHFDECDWAIYIYIYVQPCL